MALTGGDDVRRPTCTAPITGQEFVPHMTRRADGNFDGEIDFFCGFLNINTGCVRYIVVNVSFRELTQY